MNEAQNRAVEELHAIETNGESLLRVKSVCHRGGQQSIVDVEIELNCAGFERSTEGIALEATESFIISIPTDFPFVRPDVSTPHSRFAGNAHVQWGQVLCLYQAPDSEWNPSDGMFGFIERLILWLDHASRGELDPAGEPLHPPVSYRLPGTRRRCVIIRADTPTPSSEPWIGFAGLKQITECRFDVITWEEFTAIDRPQSPLSRACAFLLCSPLPFEYPTNVYILYEKLCQQGIPSARLLLAMMNIAKRNDRGTPLYVIVGAPMRGIKGRTTQQHLAVWCINPDVADLLRTALHAFELLHPKADDIGSECLKIFFDWARDASTDWCTVFEDRSEIIQRRDESSPASWFNGKTVSIWGCGALGSAAAECIVRSGAKKIILRDRKTVGPGVLVRQFYNDADIGEAKASALRERLLKIRPGIEVIQKTQDILLEPIESDWTDQADIIIDSTASTAVLSKLEKRMSAADGRRTPVASIVLDARAEHCFLALSKTEHTGGPQGACRQAKLAVLNRLGCENFANAFWPKEQPRTFQPEPGCSDPTFIGSMADVMVMGGLLVNAAGKEMASADDCTAAAHFFRRPDISTNLPHKNASFRWQQDHVVSNCDTGVQVRMSSSAWLEIKGWINRSARINGPAVETGGFLFGERDEASGVIWIDEVCGPPADSVASSDEFICGIKGVKALNEEKKDRSRGTVQIIGSWHVHPNSAPSPSRTDFNGMAAILGSCSSSIAKSLLLIVGFTKASKPVIGAYDFSESQVQAALQGRLHCSYRFQDIEEKTFPKRVGLALSGGGSRAIAFHLGCLRALHDRGVLDQVDVISSVSGGSVIAASYAYSSDSFDAFDHRMTALLKEGLVKALLRNMLSPSFLLRLLWTIVTAGVVAKVIDVLRTLGCQVLWIIGSKHDRIAHYRRKLQTPLLRKVTRTDAFVQTLKDKLFGDLKLPSQTRNGINIVINACELQSGTSFQFGNRESGCWRYGRLLNQELPIAMAVGASAAYPLLLPALDRELIFTDRTGVQTGARVVLTDGGIYDNLGMDCMEPGRSSDFSCNVFQPKYIILCDAGTGQFDNSAVPYWWSTRVIRSFESVFRKAQTSSYRRLHNYLSTGALSGFVMCYLGQQDKELTFCPEGFVSREEVISYPTDFSAMSDDAIETLTARGEILMRSLMQRYCSEL